MEENGYSVEVKDVQDPAAVKSQYKVPPTLQSCHTAIVDGYVIEGHVPVEDIERLLQERPDVIGLAVPGMPSGSPGMESPGVPPVAYEVLAFDASGNVTLFASHSP